jgi:hypothetical protein
MDGAITSPVSLVQRRARSPLRASTVSTATQGSRPIAKRRHNALLAIVLGLVALGFYVVFVVAGVLSGHAP